MALAITLDMNHDDMRDEFGAGFEHGYNDARRNPGIAISKPTAIPEDLHGWRAEEYLSGYEAGWFAFRDSDDEANYG